MYKSLPFRIAKLNSRHGRNCVLLFLMFAKLTASVFAQNAPGSSTTPPTPSQVKNQEVIALQHLHNHDLEQALEVLGQAVGPIYSSPTNAANALQPAAGALYRQLTQRDADERFDLLYEWSMPTASRHYFRSLSALVPHEAPPKAFARALGERPRDHSFAVAEINGVRGLFSTAWLLVQSAEETGRLNRLAGELKDLSEKNFPGAAEALLLAQIVAADRQDAALQTALNEYLARLRREQPPKLLGKGPVPHELVWQFGYMKHDPQAVRIDFQPFPYWTGTTWQGGPAYPDTNIGWTMVNAAGGHAGQNLSAVRRWVAPAEGTLSVTGTLRHLHDEGDGVRSRIVSSRLGSVGEWSVHSDETETTVDGIEVHAWDTLDFVSDRREHNSWDGYVWPVKLKLTTPAGEVFTYDSTADFHGPTDENTLTPAVVAAACIGQEWLRPLSAAIFERLVERTILQPSPLLRPFLRKAHAVAVVKQRHDVDAQLLAQPHLQHWVVANGRDSATQSQGATPASWLAYEDHILHLAGSNNDALFFRYPLTGQFEFTCEAQQADRSLNDPGLIYGGMQFVTNSGRHELNIADVNFASSTKQACPFVRPLGEMTFNRLTITSTATGATFAVNGHPVWGDQSLRDSSPWLALQASADRRPAIRNCQFTGNPTIPREVHLCDQATLRGWQSWQFGASPSAAGVAAPQTDAGNAERPPDLTNDWSLRNGTIHSAKHANASIENSPSLLRYQRPLLDKESISFEFFYAANEVSVHPALGRLAFLIEPEGVRLHWLTDGPNDWTGLTTGNAIVEPLNRRGPRSLPLNEGQWNRITLALSAGTLTLVLNDTKIYERRLETPEPQQFGLFHDRRLSAAQVRNVVMTGDWPDKLPTEIVSNLTASATTDPSLGELHVLSDLFGHQLVMANIIAIRERAAALPAEERYHYLSQWVLPGKHHPNLRLACAFTPTHPAPTATSLTTEDRRQIDLAGQKGRSRVEIGGRLVSPAIDLIDAAKQVHRLDELADTLAAYRPQDRTQQRAKLAFEFLIEAARGNQQQAGTACEQLLTLREQDAEIDLESQWYELLVAHQGSQDPQTFTAVADLCAHLFAPVLAGSSNNRGAWGSHLAAILGNRRIAEMPLHQDAAVPTNDDVSQVASHWLPASSFSAQTRGEGYPTSNWHRQAARVDKLSPHDVDLLFYRIPLTGDFDVECDAAVGMMDKTGLMFGGLFYAYRNMESFDQGNVRDQSVLNLDQPLDSIRAFARFRMTVRNRICTMYCNGREISKKELPEHHEPWLAVYSDGRRQSAVQDLQITGTPVIPEILKMTAEPQLLGWLPYYGTEVGAANSQTPWRYLDDPAGGGILGEAEKQFAGSHYERLLRYQRPLADSAVVSYEFYYVPGEVHTHPALDRLAFLLDPNGVDIHWLTDGPYDNHRFDPANRTTEPANRRGPAQLPLQANEWNQLELRLHDHTVQLVLNGQLVYERRLEPANQRTFGLFHYADQTEVRVRNVVMRGDWPLSLPTPADQELAAREVEKRSVDQPQLSAVFEHDFVANGFPDEYFKVLESNYGQITPREDGLNANVTALNRWTAVTFSPRFVPSGNFDIEVAFDQFAPQGEKDAGLILNFEVDDERRSQYRVMRMKASDQIDQLYASQSVLRPDNSRGYDVIQSEVHEALSGRLKLSRRGTQMYYLFAEGDSAVFQLVGTDVASAADATPDGIMVRAISNVGATSAVVWKNITLRAEKLMWHRPEDSRVTRRLVVMNADGTGIRELVGPRDGFVSVGSPEWSFDGKQLAYDGHPASFSGSHIFLVNTTGARPKDCGPGSMPSFSRDGRQLAFSQPGQGIMLMDADGTNRQSIDPTGWGAQWSPDGKMIAWGQGGNISVMDVATKKRRLLLVGEQATLFSNTFWNMGWSHDSRSIAFKARNRRNNGEDIVVADVDSPAGFKILLASSKGVHPDFSWTPDNKQVLFAMNNPTHNGPQLYLLDRTQDAPPQLLPRQPLDWKLFNCDWFASGGKIAFTGDKIQLPIPWPPADKSLLPME